MTTPSSALHDLALMAGAMPIGDQFLFTDEQLARLVTAITPASADLLRLHDRAEKAGIKAKLFVDI